MALTKVSYSMIQGAPINVVDFGAKCDGVTDDSAALFAANAAAISAGVPLTLVGVMYIPTSTTITAQIVDTLNQLFTTTSSVTVNNELPVRPEWWGNGATGFACAVQASNLIVLANATYQSPYTVTALQKDNVKIIGSKQPRFKADNTGLENGTIIQGKFAVQAQGFQICDLGVDAGSAVCTALNNGNPWDGLISYTITSVPTFKDFVVKNITAIAQSPSALVHAVALENQENLVADNIRTRFGVHGQAYKCIKSNVSNLYASGHQDDGVIIKAAAVAACYLSNFNNIYIDGITANYADAGLRFTANENGPVLFATNVSNLNVYNTAYGISFDTINNDQVTGLNVTNFNIQEVGYHGITAENNTIRGVHFSNGTVRSAGITTTGNGVSIPNTCTDITITDVTALLCTGAGFAIGSINQGQNKLTNCIAERNTGYGFVIDPYVYTTNITGFNNTAGEIYGQEQAPTLLNGWSNYGGATKPATYYRDGTYVVLQGLIAGGSSGANAFVLPVGFRPDKQLWFTTISNGTATTIVIGTDGSVNVTGGTTYLSLDGIRFKFQF